MYLSSLNNSNEFCYVYLHGCCCLLAQLISDAGIRKMFSFYSSEWVVHSWIFAGAESLPFSWLCGNGKIEQLYYN